MHKLMHPPNQKDLQSVLFDPLERGRIPLLLDIFNKRALAGVHRTLHSLGALPAHSDVLSNV